MYDKQLYEAYGYSLDEGDTSYRDAERAWLSSGGNEESAQAFLQVARRYHETRSQPYYKALWAVGERPPTDIISSRAIMLSDAVDSILQFMQHQQDGAHTLDAIIELFTHVSRGPAGLHARWRGFSTRVDRAITSSASVALDSLIEMADYVGNFVDNAPKVLPRVKNFYKDLWTPELKRKVTALGKIVEHFRGLW